MKNLKPPEVHHERLTDPFAISPALAAGRTRQPAACRLHVRPPPPAVAQTPPAVPTGLGAVAGDRSVTLTWTNPNDASIAVYQYQVNHNATATGTGRLSGWSAWQNVPGSGASTASHTFSGLKNGSEYRYKIRAAKEWIEDQYITQVATYGTP